MTGDLRFHSLLGAAWILAGTVLAVTIAMTSAERTTLGRRMGAEREAQQQLATERDRVRSSLDWLASPPELEAAVNRVGLTLTPPPRVASR
jgi:hypothetical protein